MARKVIGRISGGSYSGEKSSAIQKDSFNAMLATQSPPALHNDDTRLFHNKLNPFPNMPESLRQHYLKQSREMGIEPNGKVYMTGLVRPEFKGRFDPQALVDSTHDVKRTIENRGWSCEGMVNVEGPEIAPEEVKPFVAEDLVHDHAVADAVATGATEMRVSEFKKIKEKTRARLEGAK